MTAQERSRLDCLLAAAKATLDFYRGRDKAEPGRRSKEGFERALSEEVLGYQQRTARRLKQGAQAPATDDIFLYRVTDIVSRAAQSGIVLLAMDAAIGIDVALGAQVANAWAQSYARDLVNGIAGTTANQIADAVGRFASTPGVTLGDIAGQLFSPEVNLSRAYSIATTEITRAYAESNAIVARQLAQRYPGMPIVKRWATNNDSLVCPVCGPLNQKEIAHDALFKSAGKEFNQPPAHPNCRCWMLTYPKP